MKRRWIIRSIFMLPILLCIVGWEWSATHSFGMLYSHYDYFFCCNTYWGCVSATYQRFDLTSQPGAWDFAINSTDHHFLWASANFTHQFLGFAYKVEPHLYTLVAPYWFLILVFSGVLWIVWRRTRPKPKGGAFPVEVKASGTA